MHSKHVTHNKNQITLLHCSCVTMILSLVLHAHLLRKGCLATGAASKLYVVSHAAVAIHSIVSQPRCKVFGTAKQVRSVLHFRPRLAHLIGFLGTQRLQ